MNYFTYLQATMKAGSYDKPAPEVDPDQKRLEPWETPFSMVEIANPAPDESETG